MSMKKKIAGKIGRLVSPDLRKGHKKKFSGRVGKLISPDVKKGRKW